MLVRKLRLRSVLWLFAPHIVGFAVWSVAVIALHTLSHFPNRWGQEPGVFAWVSEAMSWSQVGIPFGAIAALGGALAIFLGFRNNSAYDRWWEARKIWGALVNDSRTWARQVVAWVEAPQGVDDAEADRLRAELVHRHLAFVHGLAHHLRGQKRELTAAVRRFVHEEEAERYDASPNTVTALLIEQGRRVAQARGEGWIEHFRHLAMDEILTRLSDIQGKCERIKNTPLPRQYDALPRWFTYFYGAMLPFGLVEPIGWGAVPVAVSITVIFLALELSGRYVEDPFENAASDTPMTALAVTIERDLRFALGEALPEPAKPNERGVTM